MGACAVVGVYIADLLSGQWKRLSFPYKFSAGKDCGLHGISIMDSLESMKEIGRPKVHLFGTARRSPLIDNKLATLKWALVDRHPPP